jgi:hypothetical protein
MTTELESTVGDLPWLFREHKLKDSGTAKAQNAQHSKNGQAAAFLSGPEGGDESDCFQEAAANQATQTHQSRSEHAQSAGFGNSRLWSAIGESS